MDPSGWCTIESDPGVFTELISSIGVKGVQVEELYALDSDTIAQLSPVYGLIFLFKWTKDTQRPQNASDAADYPHIYFANQVINNACATQAIISILMNCPQIDLGPHLSEFRRDTLDFPPDMKGLALGNSELIRTSHNSFAKAEPFVMEGGGREDDDVYHFTAYLPIGGGLFELDGLQKGPTLLASLDNDRWWEQAEPVIQERIARYSASEIRFNLLAIVKNRSEVLRENAGPLLGTRQVIVDQITAKGGDSSLVTRIPLSEPLPPVVLPSAEEMVALHALPIDELVNRLAVMSSDLQEIETSLEQEKRKFAAWKKENERRRYNYIPFIVSLLKNLAQKNLLPPLVEKAKGAAERRVEREKENKAKKAKQQQ